MFRPMLVHFQWDPENFARLVIAQHEREFMVVSQPHDPEERVRGNVLWFRFEDGDAIVTRVFFETSEQEARDALVQRA